MLRHRSTFALVFDLAGLPFSEGLSIYSWDGVGMDTLGRHLILDVWYNVFSEEVFQEKMDRLVHGNFQVVQTSAHRFVPQGETRIYILSESHVAVHTYPEHRYVSVDIYICNPLYDLDRIAREVLEFFPCAAHLERTVQRGRKVFEMKKRNSEMTR
jgi:S-adenosylmethionine/arginine decarboxylase-like enzyme